MVDARRSCNPEISWQMLKRHVSHPILQDFLTFSMFLVIYVNMNDNRNSDHTHPLLVANPRSVLTSCYPSQIHPISVFPSGSFGPSLGIFEADHESRWKSCSCLMNSRGLTWCCSFLISAVLRFCKIPQNL